MEQKHVKTEIGMSREKNRYLVRELFSIGEAMCLIMAMGQVIAQNAHGNEKQGLPEGLTQEQWDESTVLAFRILGKLWVALPPNAKKMMKAQLEETFKLVLQLDEVEETDDCEAAAPATPPPGETL